jgi:lipid A 3-O-deacylase
MGRFAGVSAALVAAGMLAAAGTAAAQTTVAQATPRSWGPASSVAQAPAASGKAEMALGPEIRGGVQAHDVGFFGGAKENGVDINLEYLFGSLEGSFFKAIGSPRPHIGLSVNTSGDTSQAYAGLSWQYTVYGPYFIGGSVGLSLNNGKTETRELDRKELGSHVLFRESVEIGVRILPQHSLSIMLDHISNARLFDHNEGMETIGLRYGYRF